MAEDFSGTLFTEARSHHETARRWFCIAIAGLAIFHVMIFTPYLDLANKKREASHALVSNQKSKDQLDKLAPDLAKLQDISSAAADQQLNRLLSDLRTDFGQLNQVISELIRMGPDQAGTETGARLFAERDSPSQILRPMAQIQLAIPNAAARLSSDEPTLPSMSAAQRRQIAVARTSESSLIEAIRPYVEEQLIAPKFQDFNQRWQKEVIPAATSLGHQLLQKIQDASRQSGEQPSSEESDCGPNSPASWNCLAQAVSRVVRTTEQFAIEPPTDARWWQTVQGKGETFSGFQVSITEIKTRSDTALAELQEKTSKAVAESKKGQDEIDQQIAQLNDESQKLQQELAGLVAPLKSISIDLATVVPYFPLALAIAFVTLTGLLATRLQELGAAVAAFAQENTATSAVDWFHHRVLRSPWHRGDAIAARSIGLVAWISLASWQLATAGPPQAPSAAVLALLAAASAIGIGLASGYQWRAARSFDAADVAPKVDVLAA